MNSRGELHFAGTVLFGSWEQNPDMGNLWGFYRLHGYYFGDPYISGLAL